MAGSADCAGCQEDSVRPPRRTSPWLRGRRPASQPWFCSCRQGCVPKGRVLPLSGPQIPHLYNGCGGNDDLQEADYSQVSENAPISL